MLLQFNAPHTMPEYICAILAVVFLMIAIPVFLVGKKEAGSMSVLAAVAFFLLATWH